MTIDRLEPTGSLASQPSSDDDLTTWLDGEERRLLHFARGARTRDGFGYLDEAGHVLPGAGIRLLITARMTHVFSLAAVRGDIEAREYAEHGIRTMLEVFWDQTFGGWLSRIIAPECEDDVIQAAIAATSHKSAHDHASVVLAAATAEAAAIPGAGELLERSAAVLIARFWDEESGALVDSFTRDWSVVEDYRGARANMRFVEVALAVHAVTGDAVWLHRARRVAERIIGCTAADNGWRVVEHYDSSWTPLPEYNSSNRTDPFRPYGWLVGHQMEWSKLLIALARALRSERVDAEWMIDAAIALYGTAIDHGWQPGRRPGFVFSLDWDDAPVIGQRMHSVVADAIGASWALGAEVGHPVYTQRYRAFWAYARANFVDTTQGSWRHELGHDLRPSARMWRGKPDVFHAYGAVVIPFTAYPLRSRQFSE